MAASVGRAVRQTWAFGRHCLEAALRRFPAKRGAAATESRLVLEERERCATIQNASTRQRAAVAAAAAHWAANTVKLKDRTLDRALANLALGKAVSPALALAVERLASYLDAK